MKSVLCKTIILAIYCAWVIIKHCTYMYMHRSAQFAYMYKPCIILNKQVFFLNYIRLDQASGAIWTCKYDGIIWDCYWFRSEVERICPTKDRVMSHFCSPEVDCKVIPGKKSSWRASVCKFALCANVSIDPMPEKKLSADCLANTMSTVFQTFKVSFNCTTWNNIFKIYY